MTAVMAVSGRAKEGQHWPDFGKHCRVSNRNAHHPITDTSLYLIDILEYSKITYMFDSISSITLISLWKILLHFQLSPVGR